jgi:hypothetical protein
MSTINGDGSIHINGANGNFADGLAHDPLQPYKTERFDDGFSYDTIQVHGGHRPDKETHARAVPIYNSVVSSPVPCIDGINGL